MKSVVQDGMMCVDKKKPICLLFGVFFQDILQRQNTLDSSSIDLGYSGAPENRELFSFGQNKVRLPKSCFSIVAESAG